MEYMLSKVISALVLTVVSFGTVAQSLTVVPSGSSIQVGDDFTVSINADGLGDGLAPSIGVFDLNLSFDADRLLFVGANYGSGLDVLGLGSIRSTTEGVGTINLFELSLDSASDLSSLQPGSFSLAVVTFRALAAGNSSLTILTNSIGDGDGVAISLIVTNGQVLISAVPEGQTWLLLIFGLCGLCLFLRVGRAKFVIFD